MNKQKNKKQKKKQNKNKAQKIFLSDYVKLKELPVQCFFFTSNGHVYFGISSDLPSFKGRCPNEKSYPSSIVAQNYILFSV